MGPVNYPDYAPPHHGPVCGNGDAADFLEDLYPHQMPINSPITAHWINTSKAVPTLAILVIFPMCVTCGERKRSLAIIAGAFKIMYHHPIELVVRTIKNCRFAKAMPNPKPTRAANVMRFISLSPPSIHARLSVVEVFKVRG